MMTSTHLYPLVFSPIYKEKVWGGRALEHIGRKLPGSAANGIGESWEIADLATTSISGGGGNAEYSVVAQGSLQGRSIRQLMQELGESMLGRGVKPADDGGFPLLVKFLDAKENLSVQVHPSPAYAAQHADAYLKSEAWYIIDCEPGAVIYKGLKPGTTPAQLREAIQTNTDAAVVPLLNAIEVKPGDCHYLPSGTLHALGAGVLVAEVQTPSDTTYRVYDWGRTDRALHVEQAMACIDFDAIETRSVTQATSSEGGFNITRKAACDFFIIDEYQCAGQAELDISADTCQIWISIQSSAAASFKTHQGTHSFAKGQTALLPACLGAVQLQASGQGRWLRVTLPTSA